MLILAIETSTSTGSFAISNEGKIIFQDYADMKITHSESIMVRIDNAMNSLKISKTDLKGVCVSIGPGSFTGLRIGLATAKGICSAFMIPLIAFNTLEILACNVYGSGKNILSLIDARMNEVYMAVYDENFNNIIESCCRKYDDIVNVGIGDYLCVGDIHLLPKEDRFIKALPHQNLINAAAMFSLMKLKKIDFTYDEKVIERLEPNYIRNVK